MFGRKSSYNVESVKSGFNGILRKDLLCIDCEDSINYSANRNCGKSIPTKLSAAIIAISIIIVLLFSGPANAFVLNISSDKTSVEQGEEISFTAIIDINSNEKLPIESIALEIKGVENFLCVFAPNGTIISGCEGTTITLIDKPNYSYGYNHGYNEYVYNWGYGYGYGQGKLKYSIVLDTKNYEVGEYSTILKLNIGVGTETFAQNGPYFVIKKRTITKYSSGGCLASWTCTEWSSCSSNGMQYRECWKLKNNCDIGEEPATEQSCDRIHLNNDYRFNLNEPANKKYNARTTQYSMLGKVNQTISNALGDYSNKPKEIALIVLIISDLLLLIAVLVARRRERILLRMRRRRMKKLKEMKEKKVNREELDKKSI